MRRALIVAAIIAAALPASPASAAEFFDGNRLYVHCRSADWQEKSICLGYVMGWTDFHLDMDASLAMGSIRDWTPIYCRPNGSTNGQLMDVVAAYLRDHPERRHGLAFVLVGEALGEAFPC